MNNLNKLIIIIIIPYFECLSLFTVQLKFSRVILVDPVTILAKSFIVDHCHSLKICLKIVLLTNAVEEHTNRKKEKGSIYIDNFSTIIDFNTYGERDWREWLWGIAQGEWQGHGPMQLNLNTACFFINVTIKVAQSCKKVKQALSYYFLTLYCNYIYSHQITLISTLTHLGWTNFAQFFMIQTKV